MMHVRTQITVADLAYVHAIGWADVLDLPVPWEEFPKLTILRKTVEETPRIKKWLATRPKTYW